MIGDILRPIFGVFLAIVLITIGVIVVKNLLKKPTPIPQTYDDFEVSWTPPVRKGWKEPEKEKVRIRQDGKCAMCTKPPPRWEYDHIDGNRENNDLSNCQGLCPNCHSVKTHEGD